MLTRLRKACVNAALTVHGNPLLGAGPKKKPPKEDLEAMLQVRSRVKSGTKKVRQGLLTFTQILCSERLSEA